MENFVADYHRICNINTPKEVRKEMYIGDIYENACECLSCGDYIRSRNRHDFRTCKCGAVSVDGGSHYAKRSGDPTMIKEKIKMFKDLGEDNGS